MAASPSQAQGPVTGRVLIVGRTLMRDGILCIGGHDLDNDWRALRLRPNEKHIGWLEHRCPFHVGEEWEVLYQPVVEALPPHTEDVRVLAKQRLSASTSSLAGRIRLNCDVWEEGAEVFGGAPEPASGAGNKFFIPEDSEHVPKRSTGYWLPPSDLHLEEPYAKSSNARPSFGYRWRKPDGDERRIPYVGAADPEEIIRRGCLVRLSLARLWPPDDGSQRGYRLMLSGWFPE